MEAFVVFCQRLKPTHSLVDAPPRPLPPRLQVQSQVRQLAATASRAAGEALGDYRRDLREFASALQVLFHFFLLCLSGAPCAISSSDRRSSVQRSRALSAPLLSPRLPHMLPAMNAFQADTKTLADTTAHAAVAAPAVLREAAAASARGLPALAASIREEAGEAVEASVGSLQASLGSLTTSLAGKEF